MDYSIYGDCSVTAIPRAPAGKSLDVNSCYKCVQCVALSMNKEIKIDSGRSIFSLSPSGSKTFKVFKLRNSSAVVSDSDCRNGREGSESELSAPIRVSCLGCGAADAYTSFSSDCCSQELWTNEVDTGSLCLDEETPQRKRCHQLCGRSTTNCDEYYALD